MTFAFRSKLFVPGSRTELFAKAMASAADSLSFDLEDAVAPDRKADARDAVAEFLSGLTDTAGKLMIVRVNGYGTQWFADDIDVIVAAGAGAINIPAVDDPAMLLSALDVIRAAEARHERDEIPLLINIETPRGLRHAAEIAVADPRVHGLNTGYSDMFEPYAISRKSETALGYVRMATKIAAAEAGIGLWDGAYAAVSDPDGYRAECVAIRDLGFAGKTCIHPSQIPIANEVFSPDPEKLEWARRVVEADEDAIARGLGAVLLDGKMIDLPFVVGAKALLASAARFER